MKNLNIVAPWHTKEAWNLVIHCVSAGFRYDQAKELLNEIDYRLEEDQYNKINDLFDIAVDLDIGARSR